ncbi:MAG: twin-arginine translocation pathway signal protein [Amylibacter sp.]|nr:twin-arginine translocation pathway signal protein [Amylibacter sp.]
MKRRNALKVLGGGFIFSTAALGGVGTYVATRKPKTARLPWGSAGNYTEIRHIALSYALLAANPHNQQPWIVELVGDDRLHLWKDKTRLLPETDPYGRQINIGLGCFLEQMVLASKSHGYDVVIDVFPSGQDGPVATAVFSKGANRDYLFDYILERRSCKKPFEDKLVSRAQALNLAPYASVEIGQGKVSEIKKITWDAYVVEATTPRIWKESVDLMRLGVVEVDANPDGISLTGGLMEIMTTTGILTRENSMDMQSTGFRKGMEIFHTKLHATPAYVYLKSQQNTPDDQVAIGRQWARLNLKTTEMGLSLHPVSQALQEYPEMAEQYRNIHDLLVKPGETVQMLGRLGYGPDVPPAPRWPLEEKLKNG